VCLGVFARTCRCVFLCAFVLCGQCMCVWTDSLDFRKRAIKRDSERERSREIERDRERWREIERDRERKSPCCVTR